MSLLVSVELHAPWSLSGVYSDITGSFWGREWVQAWTLPYITSSFEYPVLSGLLLYLVRALGPDLTRFYVAFSGISLAAGYVIAWSSWGISRKLGRNLNPAFFLLPSFIVYGIYNFDLFHIMFVLLAIFSYLSGRRDVSAVFLGLGIDLKLTSAVLIPVFLMDVKGARSRLEYLAVLGGVVALFNVPFALLNLSNFLAGYQFIGNWGLEDAWYVWIFQSQSTWWFAKIFGFAVMGLLLLRVYTLRVSFMTKVVLAVASYLLGTYIYAPQFNLLVIPLLALVDFQHPTLFPWDGFNAMIIFAWFIGCCGSSWHPTLAGSWAQVLAVLRDLFLVWLCLSLASREGISLRSWFRSKTQRERPRF
jgi:hypothetical protein